MVCQTRWTTGVAARLALATLALGLAACTPTDAGETPAAEATVDPAASAGSETAAPATSVVGDVTDAVSDTMKPGQGMGAHMGNMHRRMQDTMHRAMLDEAVAQELISAEDVELFLKVHAAIEPYMPAEAGMGMGMQMADEAKKAMERGFVTQAVAAGTVTQAEADRFTAVHDLLIDEGIMARFENDEASAVPPEPVEASPSAP
ncbi:MAG TPA: hypothetical protein PK826_07910 [Anaerolineae bacterium]|nr:hypothetical protein [Ardenticatenia bacterium]HQZ71235.1 hypothetical protein [Anaerolineae bacterium]HRA20379.1 hypothetical protein [Anaerolineae bacterium]